ncbi:hypothetical protein [Mycobacterium sp. D16R24]|nr:hypothetical protein [Mycobacterium sp. D16R24]
MTESDLLDLSGFSGWLTFADLGNADVPKKAGVYVVVRPTDNRPDFVINTPYRGDAPVPVDVLEDAWVDGERLV